jgi:hypothetical protein
MQRMQRITGRFMPRTPNEADIEAMLNDFKDAEVMLEKVRSLPACCLLPRCKVACWAGARAGVSGRERAWWGWRKHATSPPTTWTWTWMTEDMPLIARPFTLHTVNTNVNTNTNTPAD